MKLLISLFGLLSLAMALPPTKEQVEDAISAAEQETTLRREMAMKREGGTANSEDAATCPMAMYHGTRKSGNVASDKKANIMLRATKFLLEAGFSKEDLRSEHVISQMKRQRSTCPEEKIDCDPEEEFRSFDGTCNNLRRPFRGAAGTTQSRLLPATYDDGLSDPHIRSVVSGEFLPNARIVSNVIHRASRRKVVSDKINLHVFQMGQFLDHDIIATPVQGEIADCCQAENDIDNCLPIRIENQDDFNPNFFAGYCMNFARSAPEFCPTEDGENRREQINAITSFIDASNVYGSSEEQLETLRDGPFMATEEGNRLPNEPNNQGCIPDVDNGILCSVAGDHRVNVVPSLNAYHTLWVREHNRLVTLMRPWFSDDVELFQQARRILIATMQKVVYNEFLPTFLSKCAIDRYELLSEAEFEYDPQINPTATNEFGIAYRMGHTWIPRRMDIFNQEFRRVKGNLTEFTYFDPTLTYFENKRGLQGLDGLAMWLTGENSTETDTIIENSARDFLFLDALNNSFDLAALNIQRGRDHGLGSYLAYRKFCDLDSEPINEFFQLPDHTRRFRRLLRSVYSDVNDIDLFTGGLSEEPVEEGTVGPTFDCLLGKQFRDLKFGDRFWYQSEAAGLNERQQAAIDRYSMAGVLCNNYDFDKVNFPNAFRSTNTLVECGEVPQLDIEAFSPTGTRDPTRPRVTMGPVLEADSDGRRPVARTNDLSKDLENLEELLEELIKKKAAENN